MATLHRAILVATHLAGARGTDAAAAATAMMMMTHYVAAKLYASQQPAAAAVVVSRWKRTPGSERSSYATRCLTTLKAC